MASIKSEANFSHVTYNILKLGKPFFKELPIACNKCVLPSPTPPYINNGLNCLPGFFATASADAVAKRFEEPTTNLSKVNLGFIWSFITDGIGVSK